MRLYMCLGFSDTFNAVYIRLRKSYRVNRTSLNELRATNYELLLVLFSTVRHKSDISDK